MSNLSDIPSFDVSGAVAVINQTLEYALPIISVVGELDSFKVSKGKWVYGDLKDDYAKLRLFGTVYGLPGPLEDGMLIEVVGQPRLHHLYGLSLNIQSIRPVGEGSLKKAANLLAQKLEHEGLFDPERKRPVPYPPEKVGLITSTESAAYADFIKILNARWQGVEVAVYDSQVQGESAVESLAAGLTYFNQHASPVDVLVLIRGGGSIDDLAAFSSEQVVRAVAASRIPTCVAVGHEIDESLAELVADMRASTPSNAAELLFPDKAEMLRRLKLQKDRLKGRVESYVDIRYEALDRRRSELSRAVESVLETKIKDVEHARMLLEAVHPRSILKRGFALVQTKQGKLLSSKSQVHVADQLTLTVRDGAIDVRVEKV